MKHYSLVAIVFVSLVVSASAQSENAFKTKDGFSITLPSDWIEIPRDILDQVTQQAHKLVPKAPVEEWGYGYQLARGSNWMIYPYILIQVKNTGRIPEGELKQYTKVNNDFAKGMNSITNKMAGIILNAKQGETLYDPAHQILWVTMSMEVPAGRIEVVNGVKLTETGVIQIHGYAQEEFAKEQIPVMQQAISGITLDPAITYKPQLMDNAPVVGGINLGKVAVAGVRGGLIGGTIGLIAGIVGGLFGLSVWISNKRKKTPPMLPTEKP